MPDTALQRALWAATDGLSGKDFERAQIAFSKSDPVFKGIRHVRVREVLGVIPIQAATGRTYTAYKADANARFAVWRMPDVTWVSRWQVKNGRATRRDTRCTYV